MKTTTKLWIGLAALIVLSPLGLILPAWLGGSTAWGEWSAGELRRVIGYVPHGMAQAAQWNAPLPDYNLRGQERAPLGALSASYVASALLGAVVVAGIMILLGKALARREKRNAS